MKNLSTAFIFAIFWMFSALPCSAQSKDDPYFDHKISIQQRVFQLKNIVDLTPSQIEKIVDIFTRAEAKYQILLDVANNEKEFQKGLDIIVSSEIKQLKKVMTKEQKKALAQMKNKEEILDRNQKRHEAKS